MSLPVEFLHLVLIVFDGFFLLNLVEVPFERLANHLVGVFEKILHVNGEMLNASEKKPTDSSCCRRASNLLFILFHG